MWIFYKENKQTGQLIFLYLVTLTKKRKTKSGMNRTFNDKTPQARALSVFVRRLLPTNSSSFPAKRKS